MINSLTSGVIAQMQRGEKPLSPTIQFLDIKRIGNETGERWRLVLSDGINYMQGMLATQIGNMISSNQIIKNSIVCLNEYLSNNVNGRIIIIILKCEVVQKISNLIGSPVSISDAPSLNASIPQQHQIPHRAEPPPPIPISHNNNQWFYTGNSTNLDSYQPVTSLNPYQSNWKIKVRVTAKDSIKYWKNSRGEGKLFSVTFLDKEGGEILATMFNDAVDKFYHVFEVNKVYLVSRGQVKMARKQFTHIKNDYAISLNSESEIISVPDDENIDQQRYNFVKIDSLKKIPLNSHVDIIGIVESVQPIVKIMSQKVSKELDKRSILILDDTAKVQVTLWGENAIKYDENMLGGNATVAMKGARISDFGGISLSLSGSIAVWPAISEATQLRKWLDSTNGQISTIQNLTTMGSGGGPSPRKTLAEIKEQELGMNTEKGDYFTVVGTITTISHTQERPPWYNAVPEPGESAKVVEDGRGGWYCARNQKTYTSYVPRYILRFQVMDFSSSQWMTAFNDVAAKVLGGKSAVELEKILNSHKIDEWESVFQNACFKKYSFKCRARSDTYQDERRVRIDVLDILPLDLVTESHEIALKIQELRNSKFEQQN